MTEFSIKYNPYLVTCEFKKNGKELGQASKFVSKKETRFQVLLSPLPNWDGLAEEIVKVCNDDEISITFTGRKMDFEDLEYCIDRYDGSARFDLKLDEATNDNDVMNELEEILEEIKNKDIPQFNVKDENGRDVFMAFDEAKNGIFEVNVIATMSSGKSTLINSLLHTELLPSQNQACTATVATILDNDEMDHFDVECLDGDFKVVYPREVAHKEALKEYNMDEKVTYLNMEGNIPAISSDRIRLRLRDTPGPNNSRNENHGRLTNKIIRLEKAVVLYVMNATQFGIDDDHQLLQNISSEMKRAGKQSRDKFVFVVNKCDELDTEKGETIDGLLEDVRSYLCDDFGIDDPIVIPTSALMALLIRRNKRGEELTRKEEREMSSIEYYNNDPELHFDKFATLTPSIERRLNKQLEMYRGKDEFAEEEAVIHTGVPVLEETIAEYIEKYAYPMKIKDAVKDCIDIIDDVLMKANFERLMVEDKNSLEEIRMQIQSAKDNQKTWKETAEVWKKKVEKITFDIEPKSIKKEINKELSDLTRDYDNEDKVAAEEVDNMVGSFVESLQSKQSDYEQTVNRELDEKLYANCTRLLDEYKNEVDSILSNITVNGYDFSKSMNLKRVKINSVDEIISKNKKEEERYHYESYMAFNEERAGFFGFFKVWKGPRYISKKKKVHDGTDVFVDVKNVIVTIMNDFQRDLEINIDSVFDDARNQIIEYKKTFSENIDRFIYEVDVIINGLDEMTREENAIQKRVEDTKEKYEWIKGISKRIESVLEF